MMYNKEKREIQMKYVHGNRSFTTKEMSLDETIQEAMDVVAIAADVLRGPVPDVNLARVNLAAAADLMNHIRHKAKIAVDCVPADVQTREYL